VLNIPIYQGQLTLTTTGTSGAATLSGTTLNIPQYSGGGGTPAGSAGEIQFNSTPAGSFAASSNLAWDNTFVRLNIGAPSAPTGKLNTKGGGTTSSTVNLRLTNSGNTEVFRVDDDGTSNIAGDVIIANTKGLSIGVSGTNRRAIMVGAQVADNLPQITVYPASGTNAGAIMAVSPKGTGFNATLKAQFSILNTDIIADPTNIEFMSQRGSGNDFKISTGASGTGTLRPLLISCGAVASPASNTNQLWINTNGTVSLNKTSTNYQLDVTAASLFDGLRVVGSSNSSGRVALQVQSSTATLYNIDNDGKISYLATNTAAGTTGPRTIDRPSGTVNFAIGASALVVTNSLCTVNSIVFATVRTNDATAYIKNVVPAGGSFTINLGANATAETSVGFFIIN
jgi:hypothetical protein